MPLYNDLASLSTTAASNAADGAVDAPSTIDQQLNLLASFNAQLRDQKAPLASPAFTGTPTGITKAHVGLANVDNTSDAGKPVSTAQQTALNLKAPLAAPAFTGNGSIAGSFTAGFLSSTTSAQVATQLTVGGILLSSGILKPAAGIRCYAGAGLGEGGNTFSMFWTGSAMNLYADSTYLGAVSVVSDERIKKDITPASADRTAFMAIKPIVFDFASVGVFSPSDRRHFGFSAQNLTSAFSYAVDGDVEAVDDEGAPKPATVNDRPILALTVLEVQEVIKEIAELRAELAELRAVLKSQP